MANVAINEVAEALMRDAGQRDVLGLAVRAAAQCLKEQEGFLADYRRARASLAISQNAAADVARDKAAVAATLTKQAASEGRNEAERKALASEALQGSQGYKHLDRMEQGQQAEVRSSEATVEALQATLRYGQSRLALVNGIVSALASLPDPDGSVG